MDAQSQSPSLMTLNRQTLWSSNIVTRRASFTENLRSNGYDDNCLSPRRLSLPLVFPEGPLPPLSRPGQLQSVEKLSASEETVGPLSTREESGPTASTSADTLGTVMSHEKSDDAVNEDDDPGNDSDLLIVEVRKIDKPQGKSPGSKKSGARRIKQEPGLESSSNSNTGNTVPRRKHVKAKSVHSSGNKKTNKSNNAGTGTKNPATKAATGTADGFSTATATAATSSSDQIMGGMPIDPLMAPGGPFDPYAHICDRPWDLGMGGIGGCVAGSSNGSSSGNSIMTTGTNRANATSTDVSSDMTGGTLHAPSLALSSPFDNLPSSTLTAPPAYQTSQQQQQQQQQQPKSLEQIINEANSALEERIYVRLSRDIARSGAAGGLGTKRSRGVAALSLDEAETNLKTASAEYAKAKAAEERRANKRGRSGAGPGKKEEDNADFSGDGKGGKVAGEKSGLNSW